MFEKVGDLVGGGGTSVTSVTSLTEVSSVSECFMLIVSPGQSISPLLVFNISKSSQLLKHCAGNRKVVGLIPRKRGFRSNTDCECAVSE